MTYRIAALLILLAGCTTTSGVMEAEGGVYLTSATAAPAAGGATGAQQIAHEEARKFCAAKGRRPVVVDVKDRDIYQSSFAANQYGAGGGTFAAGRAQLAFRCVE